MKHVDSTRRLLVAGLAPLLLCALLAFALDARMAHGAPAAPDPALFRCFASLGTSTQYFSLDASAVQQAVDAAGPGALVKIAGDCAGVQVHGSTTQTVLVSRTLTLQGGYTTGNWLVSDPLANPTVLDAKGLGRVVNAVATSDLSLAALTVQNGAVTADGAASGGGIYAGGNLTLSQVMVVSNTLTCRGNFVICYAPGAYAPANASVERSAFLDNTCAITVAFGCYGALYAGGIAELSGTQFISNAGGGAYVHDSVIVTSSQFFSNTNGGLSVRNSAIVSGSQFVSNSIGTAGGGLSVYNGTTVHGTAMVVNSQFTNNVGSYVLNSGGGGMYAFDATVIHSLFFGNAAHGAGGGLGAGGFLVSGKPAGSATVVDSQFISNTATAGGGGLATYGTLVMTATDFISNSASSAGGASAYVTATVSGGTFQRNSASQGAGGLSVFSGPLRLEGTQFISNTTSGGFGGAGGAGLAAQRAANVSGALFRDNRCSGANCLGGGMYVSNTLTVSATQFLSNTATAGGAVYALGGGTLHGSCVAGNQLAAVTNVSGTLDATNNWWGAVNGPAPAGSGDAISGTVSANPYLTTPIFACPSLGLGLRLYLPISLR